MFKYVCMYICVYACPHACMSACIVVCSYVCLSVCMYVCIHVYRCLHVYTHVCLSCMRAVSLSRATEGGNVDSDHFVSFAFRSQSLISYMSWTNRLLQILGQSIQFHVLRIWAQFTNFLREWGNRLPHFLGECTGPN